MELVTSSFSYSNKNTLIRPVEKKEDLESVKAIARKSHIESRFFKDLNFNRQKCKIFYEKWIERDFDLGTILGFYPACDKIAHGYLTLTSESLSNARIGLLAVEDDYRGKGAAYNLIEEAIATSMKKGVKKLLVTTQGTNSHALSLYEKIGFRTSNVTIWFHKWFHHQ
jgi:dTDP-4-amino-4,6-dideoxy-D-galactose acyltransferase